MERLHKKYKKLSVKIHSTEKVVAARLHISKPRINWILNQTIKIISTAISRQKVIIGPWKGRAIELQEKLIVLFKYMMWSH